MILVNHRMKNRKKNKRHKFQKPSFLIQMNKSSMKDNTLICYKTMIIKKSKKIALKKSQKYSSKSGTIIN